MKTDPVYLSSGMTKEELLDSYLKNLSSKLKELDFNTPNREQVIADAAEIQIRMWDRLNNYFEEHFIDELTDAEIEEYFQLVKKGTAEIVASLPVVISRNSNLN